MRPDIVRRTLLAVLAPAVALTAAPASAQDEPAADERPIRIAVANIEFLVMQSPAGQELAAEIQNLRDQYASELAVQQAAADEIQRRITEADSLTQQEQRALEREYQDAVTNFQRYQQDLQQTAQARQDEGLAKIREELGPVLRTIMEEEGYDLILNSINGAVVMSSERVDITQMVLDRLQSSAANPGD